MVPGSMQTLELTEFDGDFFMMGMLSLWEVRKSEIQDDSCVSGTCNGVDCDTQRKGLQEEEKGKIGVNCEVHLVHVDICGRDCQLFTRIHFLLFPHNSIQHVAVLGAKYATSLSVA